ncbi:MAG TPA: hypothetical protein VNA57_00110 [Acidimicrobiales bacterium]|nr:hypothetical protein [Acidimicrobiales bacterium]
MNTVLFFLLVAGVFWFVFWCSGARPGGHEVPPDTRERVLAQVLLHQARRSRQLAEFERAITEGAERRLAELERDWPAPTCDP